MSDNVSVKSTQPDSPPAGYTATTYKVTTRQADDNSQIQQVQLDIGTGTNKSPVTSSNPLPTEDPRMVFTNDGKLQVNATVTMGEVTIEETHIVDPLTATAANVKSDGVNNGLVVVQNSQPLPTGAATSDLQTSGNNLIGAVTETAPGTDTASSGLNGRLQRIAQRLTSLIALLPTALGAGGGIKVDGSGTALPVSGTVTVQQSTASNLKVDLSGTAANSTAIKVDNSAVTQPVSGSVTANAGTNLNTSALALESGGNLASLAGTVGAVAQTPSQVNAVRVQVGPGDIISNLPVTIDYDHHQVHEGETFRWSVLVASLANNASKDIRLVVPSIAGVVDTTTAVRKCPHFRFEVVASLAATVFLYEAPTFTGNGTQRTPVAMERNGTYTPQLQVWEDPTVSVVGTLMYQGQITTSKNAAGSTEGPSVEFVLKNNTSYLFRATSAANSNQVLMRMVWYEDLGV